jgi:hypothetical protein
MGGMSGDRSRKRNRMRNELSVPEMPHVDGCPADTTIFTGRTPDGWHLFNFRWISSCLWPHAMLEGVLSRSSFSSGLACLSVCLPDHRLVTHSHTPLRRVVVWERKSDQVWPVPPYFWYASIFRLSTPVTVWYRLVGIFQQHSVGSTHITSNRY